MYETLPEEKTIDKLLEERGSLQENLDKLKSNLNDIEINQSDSENKIDRQVYSEENKNSIIRQANFLETQINLIDKQIDEIQGILNKQVV